MIIVVLLYFLSSVIKRTALAYDELNHLQNLNAFQVQSLFDDCNNEINLSIKNSVIFNFNMYFRVVSLLSVSPLMSFGIMYSLDNKLSALMKEQTSIIYKENSNFDFINKLKVRFLSIDATLVNEMLIVLTTCNQLNMTVLALEYIKDTFNDADLIIVDDYSIDGTPEYLIKKGYTVITKEHAKGLTDSWNKGYEFANALNYKYVIFTNNDVLLTSTTVKIMKEDLKNEALVGPLTTLIGAGHNPSQVF